jgi:hypothetical protein
MRSFENSVRALVLVGLVSVIFGSAQRASAEPIHWKAPVAVNKNDPTQVITTGTLVAHGGQVSPDQTINGVTFGSFFLGNNVNVSVLTPTGGVAGPYAPNDTPYAHFLSAGIYRAAGGNATIHITGLTPGTGYDVQLFTPYWDNNFQTSFSDGVTSVAMGNTSSQPTYLIGQWVADASTQDIFYTAASGSSFGLFAAAQVRTSIPEPTSAALFGLAALALFRRGKRAA